MTANLTLDRNAMKDPSTAHLRIYVGNLSEQANQDNLYEHFSPFGKILGIAVNRGFGFVQFEAEQSVQDAINKARGSTFLGKSISVKPVQTNKKEPENIQSEPPPSAVLSENNIPIDDELQYDEYGNFIGDGAQEDPYANQWGDDKWAVDKVPGGPGRGRGNSMGRGGPVRGRGGQRGRGGYRERSPLGRGDWGDRGYVDRYPPPDYPRALPVSDKNDCEIIVVSKTLTEYAEYIEQRLKRLGIVVDLLFPMEDVPIGKVLGNIASRGCLYAILVMPPNQEHRSLTLTILHGLPQEHRNMPLEDALQLLSRNFAEVQRGGGASGREAVFALLGQLADGRSLTALQYDKVIKYLQERREQQVKVELGEPLEADKTQVDLQQRILSILNEKPPAEPAPAPAQPPLSQPALLQDPTVRKALDSILQKFT